MTMRIWLWISAVLLCASAGVAQGPVFTQEDLQTIPYEDFSDILRRFPGSYPLDYGTLGAPLFMWPWQEHPWLLRVEKDGIPQNRKYDGLYDPNLQPLGEISRAEYVVLSGDPLGTVHLASRQMPVDSPYTEFQIREGFHGFGIVDFAHGQRVYRSLTMEITGRLGWYNGLRYLSASRFNRVRGKIGLDLGRKWRSELTYAGSNVESEFPPTTGGSDTEREEGILAFHRTDSASTRLVPRLQLFLRQDRESWGNPFRAWEQTIGYVGEMRVHFPRHSVELRQTTFHTRMEFPTDTTNGADASGDPQSELTLDLQVADSVDLERIGIRLWAGLRRAAEDADRQNGSVALPRCGVEFHSRPIYNVSVHGGTQYAEESVPLAWRTAHYLIGDRPLLVAPSVFSDPNRTFMGSNTKIGDVDRYVTSSVGWLWRADNTFVDVTGIAIHKPGDFENRFVQSETGVDLVRERKTTQAAKLGVAATASVPIRYGLRVDSWWFWQAQNNDFADLADWRGYTRLYFERNFFHAPLTIRSHISYEEIGQRAAYSDRGSGYLGPNRLIGFRISATVRGVTLIWGTENFFKERYAMLPGYTMIRKEEYLAFVWR
ncbi:hypothetical protein KKH27_06865, partial [bacterium]|nr:hypothetical protein [bacterium]